MLLIGRDRSPFVRRTATMMELLGLTYERRPIATTDVAELTKVNPLGRVPALVLSDGETLIDSAAIIDYILEIGDRDHRLLAASGKPRRDALRASAFATGVMEKGVAAAYEMRQRPSDSVHHPWLQHLKGQIHAGVAELEAAMRDRQWLLGTKPGVGDVNIVVAYDFIARAHPEIAAKGWPVLGDLSKRANALSAFKRTQWSDP